MQKTLAWLFPSLKNIFFLAIFAGVLINGNRLLNADGDLGHHLAMGKLILQSGSIPQTDPFSFRTEGIHAVPHEWLAQALFSALEQSLGLGGIVLLCALLLALALAQVFGEITRRSGSLAASLLVFGLALTASTIHWISRPHLFTYLLLGLWSFQLEALWRAEHRRWWVFPLIMLVWANLHGMFVVGLLTLGLTGMGYGWQRVIAQEAEPTPGLGKMLLLAAASSGMVTFLTPSGIHIWDGIFTILGSDYITSMTSEYRSADFQDPATWPFLLLVGVGLAAGALNRKPLHAAQAATLAGWTLFGLYSARNIPLAAIVCAPIVAELLAGVTKELPGLAWLNRFARSLGQVDGQLRGWLWATVGVLLGLAWLAQAGAFNPLRSPYQFSAQIFPVQATQWLEKNPQQGFMFNEFDWGGYLLYRLWPEQKIFMDGHTHIYGDQMTREYGNVVALEGDWMGVLDKYQVRWAILRRNTRLAAALQSQGWQVNYQDELSIILQRPATP